MVNGEFLGHGPSFGPGLGPPPRPTTRFRDRGSSTLRRLAATPLHRRQRPRLRARPQPPPAAGSQPLRRPAQDAAQQEEDTENGRSTTMNRDIREVRRGHGRHRRPRSRHRRGGLRSQSLHGLTVVRQVTVPADSATQAASTTSSAAAVYKKAHKGWSRSPPPPAARQGSGFVYDRGPRRHEPARRRQRRLRLGHVRGQLDLPAGRRRDGARPTSPSSTSMRPLRLLTPLTLADRRGFAVGDADGRDRQPLRPRWQPLR